jgi:acetoacetyl-CoA synthetase
LWEPTPETIARAALTRYLEWLRAARGLAFHTYSELWQWSVTDLEAFWATIWEFCGVTAYRPYTRILPERRVSAARWCPGAELNYAQHVLRRQDDHPALLFQSEDRPLVKLTYAELGRQVAAVAAGLRRAGVGRGDRVAAYLPNIPEAVVAFLAAASLGAIWSSCPPEFGTRSVVERFRQIGPRVLFAVDGYRYQGRSYDRRAAVEEIRRQLPSLETTVIVPYLDAGPGPGGGSGDVRPWQDLLAGTAEDSQVRCEPVPFDHPLWIVYSSGTTGLPKAIVHGHGGILLELLKALTLHLDLRPEDRFFWFTTTGWVMWNILIGGLLLGTTVVLYDGSPTYPDIRVLWRLAAETEMTYFGTSAPYIQGCMKAGIVPAREADLRRLRGLGSTGAPLPPEGFQWVYNNVSRDLLLGSVSGGTDVCTAFLLSCPILPVRAGEIQCRGLGAKVEAFDEQGRPVIGKVGELVITEPLPSMPVFFWDDPEMRRYRASYFETFPDVWRHGDWIKITPQGGCVIYGRSDSTLNRGGVRIGTSEFYRVVEEMPEVLDSLVVDTGRLGREGRLLLFVVLRGGAELDAPLQARIRKKLREELSPRHSPDEIYAVAEIPRTLNAKKLEVPVKRILDGVPPEAAVSPDAMSNPQSLRVFTELARRMTKDEPRGEPGT